MAKNGTVAFVSKFPKCDLCESQAEYDFQSKRGPWAFGCSAHWIQLRAYVDLGIGQGAETGDSEMSDRTEIARLDKIIIDLRLALESMTQERDQAHVAVNNLLEKVANLEKGLNGDQIAVAKLLTSSWTDINFNYDDLAPEEKSCITFEQFRRVNAWRLVTLASEKYGNSKD